MKKKYIKPEIENVVMMPHFNLLTVSNLDVHTKSVSPTVNEDDYDSLL